MSGFETVHRAREARDRQAFIVVIHADGYVSESALLRSASVAGSEKLTAFAEGRLRGSVFRWRELDEVYSALLKAACDARRAA